MNSEYIMIQKQLLKSILDENAKLKEELNKNKEEKKEEPIKGQITIDDYTKSLKKGNK